MIPIYLTIYLPNVNGARHRIWRNNFLARPVDEIWKAGRHIISRGYNPSRSDPLIRRYLDGEWSSRRFSPPREHRKGSRNSICNGSTLPFLIPGKLSVLLDTCARRGVTSRRHSSKIVDNLSGIDGNFPSCVYATSSEERFSRPPPFARLSRDATPRTYTRSLKTYVHKMTVSLRYTFLSR